ncbi:MAG: LacI family DNA-binding transcriptional regulator [Lachnospiraceae bacterium]|nr:LacI family transcriptional regulator [Agathobacter sp.]MDD6291403.1 LacI family DNA-binding transcriptional regulator [Lachnospiraceae bacterium]
MKSDNITISDIAEALGVSKTTVSRAISGKGRIGEVTRKRVLDYIEEHDYKPNVIARGLAQSKTFNLCVVMPGNYAIVDLPFFQEVIAGIQEIAGMNEYDILLCICQENDISNLERILHNHKVDGVVLLRTFMKDLQIELLTERQVPFVTTGSTAYRKVKQVDNDHQSACRELTSILLMRQMKRIALLGGNESHVVTQNRYRGYVQAHEQAGIALDEEFVYMNLESRAFIDRAVENALEKGADCILCMDDAICGQVLRKLRQEHVKVPQDVKVASFYNSSVLENNIPSITSLTFDARELGMEACKNLLAQIDGEKVPERTLLSYEVVLKESTK